MNADRRQCWGFSLFCDDVRAEVGGKLSLMGLYQADYLFQGELPFIIAKFSIFIMYYELANTITSDIDFKVFLPGDDPEKPITIPFARKDFPQISSDQANLDGEDDGERIFHARIPVNLSPLMVTKEGRLKVRAHYSDGSILKLGALHMRRLTAEEATALGVATQAVIPQPPG